MEVTSLKAEINSYKKHLELTKTQLTAVLPLFKDANPSVPDSRLIPLDTFLNRNDCSDISELEEMKICYKVTRALLIQITGDAEQSDSELWAANVTIQQLLDNINVIIESFERIKLDK